MFTSSLVPSTIRVASLCRFSTVTAAMVKQLRERTGAPMMDCKKALQQEGVDGDIEKAIVVLRKQGMKRVNKVSSRTTQQGVIAAKQNEKRGVLVELACETDFVSRNELFQRFAREVSEVALSTGITDSARLLGEKAPNGESIRENMKELISKLGENIVLGRSKLIEAKSSDSFVLSYLHNCVGDSMAQIACMVSFSVKGASSAIDREALHKIGMHIAAANPSFLTRSEVTEDVLAREKSIIMEDVKKLQKPEKIVTKMIEGKLNDFYKQSVLLDQLYILDEKQGSITKLLQKIGKASNCCISIDQFIRMQVGGK